MMKLGSLFDGSGGFPLAGALNGIEPVWASEIEPYPIAVTKSRFPNMKHLGSVTDIHGKTVKHYNKEQMLKWYNGLHSDANEYKMWGNGITVTIPTWILKRVVEENEHVQSSDQ